MMSQAKMKPQTKTILVLWSFKRKRQHNGSIIKYKGHLCAHGGTTQRGVYHWECFFHVINWINIQFFLTLDIQKSAVDLCLCVHVIYRKDCWILIYIDNCLVLGEDKSVINKFSQAPKDEKFSCTREGGKGGGGGKKYLGINVSRRVDGKVLTQPHLIDCTLEATNLRKCNAKPNPVLELLLHKDKDGANVLHKWHNCLVINRLKYLTKTTRSDTVIAVQPLTTVFYKDVILVKSSPYIRNCNQLYIKEDVKSKGEKTTYQHPSSKLNLWSQTRFHVLRMQPS